MTQLRLILSDEATLRGVIRKELEEIRDTYQSTRRTEIVDQGIDLTTEDLIAEEQMVITATHNGYVKRTSLSQYRSQHRGGKGRIGMSTRTEEDIVDYLFVASTHAYILIFTAHGKLHWLKVWEIPEVGTAGLGKPIVNLINLDPEDRFADMVAVPDLNQPGHVFMVSRAGYIKKTPISAFANPRSAGIIACSVDAGDELISVGIAPDEERDILLFSQNGKAIRFSATDVRSMGRTARGVRGMRLRRDDRLIGMVVIHDEQSDLLAVTERGYGKRTPVSEYRRQGRAGQGVINIRTSERNGKVVSTCMVTEDEEIIIITENGKIIRLEVARIRQTQTRSAQGVKLIDLDEGDQVADVTLVPVEDESDGDYEPAAEDEAAETSDDEADHEGEG